MNVKYLNNFWINQELENSENNLLASKPDSEIKELKDRIIKFAFEGITTLTQSVYDLNEVLFWSGMSQ